MAGGPVCPGICWSSRFSVSLKTPNRLDFGEGEPNPPPKTRYSVNSNEEHCPLTSCRSALAGLWCANSMCSDHPGAEYCILRLHRSRRHRETAISRDLDLPLVCHPPGQFGQPSLCRFDIA